MQEARQSPEKPSLGRPSPGRRLTLAFAAVVSSSLLLGGELLMFDLRSSHTDVAGAPATSGPNGAVAQRNAGALPRS